MLIITVETQAANVNFLLEGPLAGAGVEELARSWCAGAFEGPQHRVSLDLRGGTSIDGQPSATLRLDGALRTPVDGVLRYRVESLFQSGVRRVLLDLSGVSSIDASGVGELMHLFTTASAAGGVVEIGRMSPHVRRVLEVSGVMGLMGGVE